MLSQKTCGQFPLSTGYADVRDPFLAQTLGTEDRAEDHQGLSPHDRLTCRLHRRWAHQCITSPRHVIAVTGHRWCRQCRTGLSVVVDEFAGTVNLACDRCGCTPQTPATRQIIRTCRASLAAARRGYWSTTRR